MGIVAVLKKALEKSSGKLSDLCNCTKTVGELYHVLLTDLFQSFVPDLKLPASGTIQVVREIRISQSFETEVLKVTDKFLEAAAEIPADDTVEMCLENFEWRASVGSLFDV